MVATFVVRAVELGIVVKGGGGGDAEDGDIVVILESDVVKHRGEVAHAPGPGLESVNGTLS